MKEQSDAFNSNKYLDNDDELEESDDGVSKDIEGEGRVSSHPPLTHPSPTPHPHSRQLEAILNKESSDVSPLTLILDGWSPFSPKVGGLDAEVRRVRVNLININYPKEETKH